MGLKKEWKTLKKGYKTLQKRSRDAQAMAEAKKLQSLKAERIRHEEQATRMKEVMQERTKIAKAKATIKQGRGQSGISKTARWLFVDTASKRKAPIKRSPSKKSPNYIIKGGVTYPMARKKVVRSKIIRYKPKRSKPKGSLMDEFNGLLR